MRQAAKIPFLAQEIDSLVIVGPTASGKTDLALGLARELGGEVVSADSRQLYRELDAGTAKPKRDARGLVDGIPYHLIDWAGPETRCDAGAYERAAREAIAGIRGRGKLPIIAGGTGLYVRALLEGLSALPDRDEALRRRLLEQAEALGRPWLHARLAEIDPEAARGIPANNIQRLLRALEVYELTGSPISSHWAKPRAPGCLRDPLIFSISWPADDLRRRIEERARDFWPALLAEARGLSRRYRGTEPGFDSLGYPEALACARGELAEDEALARLLSASFAYAKRQRTWFRNQLKAHPIAGGPLDAMLAQSLCVKNTPRS